jgi:hypothetical protein
MRRMVAILSLVTLTGCGSSSPSPGVLPSYQLITVPPSSTMGPSATSSSATASGAKSTSQATTGVPDATSIVVKLQAADLPIIMIAPVTPDNDVDGLLARSHGYLSKVTFTDTRVKVTGIPKKGAGSASQGGAVEVFRSVAQALARSSSIQANQKSDPAFGKEYDYVSGAVLLRVSGHLSDEQARRYQAGLG